MRVAAFDSKPFNRTSAVKAQGPAAVKGYTGHSTQLGTGVIIPNVEAFTDEFVANFAAIKGDFGIDTPLPFMPTNGLLKYGRDKAVAFADKLVTSIQDAIEGMYCCHVVLPPKKYKTIKVGGTQCPAEHIQCRSFIDKLGPMFSYLTAESYIHGAKGAAEHTEIRIDSFVSKQTVAWNNLEKLNPKVYWKGDECDPAIACADLLAFLTDVKLSKGRRRLDHSAVSEVWEPYSFDASVGTYGHSNVGICAWYSNEMIDLRRYRARPTVFLSVDELWDPSRPSGKEPHIPQGGEGAAGPEPRAVTFRQTVRQLDVYDAAVRHAFGLGGSFKMFNFREDFQFVSEQDVFVYVGDNSMKVGRTLQSMMDITVMSGADLRRLVKKEN